MGVSEELGGIQTITVAVIIVTGVLGNVIGEGVCKLFRITELYQEVWLLVQLPMQSVLQKLWKWAKLKVQ